MSYVDKSLKDILETSKNALRAKNSNSTFGSIKDGISEEEKNINKSWLDESPQTLKSYVEFIKEYSGISLGGIVLYRFHRLQQFQNLLDFLPNSKDEWICIGTILDDPIGLNKKDGKVYWFSEIPYSDEGICLGTFDEFLKEYAFGKKYAEIIPWIDDDEWYQFMIKLGLVK